jgi:hypothetical protein
MDLFEFVQKKTIRRMQNKHLSGIKGATKADFKFRSSFQAHILKRQKDLLDKTFKKRFQKYLERLQRTTHSYHNRGSGIIHSTLYCFPSSELVKNYGDH